MDLSIIILAYKSKQHLEALLPSIWQSEDVGFGQEIGRRYSAELIIVDNGSNDGTIEELRITNYELRGQSAIRNPQLQLIQNSNTGFAAGNNIGIRQASGKYILLLNPDTKVEPDTFKTMLDFMDSRSDIGIAGCKIIKPDGKLDLACRRRFPNPWNSFKRLFLLDNQDYNYTNIDENQSMEVDSVVGAFLLIGKSAIDKIGMLDEDFFMYGEDLDWCWRCKQANLKVWYYPKTFITHYKGSSSAQIPFQSLKWFHESMWIFYKKHYWQKYPLILNWLVFLGIYLRLGLLYVVNLFRSKPHVSQ